MVDGGEMANLVPWYGILPHCVGWAEWLLMINVITVVDGNKEFSTCTIRAEYVLFLSGNA